MSALHGLAAAAVTPAAAGAVCWTAVRLDEVRTDVLRALDLRHAPPWAARLVRAVLADRAREGEP